MNRMTDTCKNITFATVKTVKNTDAIVNDYVQIWLIVCVLDRHAVESQLFTFITFVMKVAVEGMHGFSVLSQKC